MYECDYCTDAYTTLSDFERHCWNEGDSHHDPTLTRVNNAAFNDTTKINLEYMNDIDNAIKSIKDRELKQELAKKRAEQERKKQDLPFVK